MLLLHFFLLIFICGCHGDEPQPPSPTPRSLFTFFNKFFSSGNNRRKDSGPPHKMRDLHRLPRPPKYPLYDLDQLGLATPPPAPAMHPLSSLPGDQFGGGGQQLAWQQRSEGQSTTIRRQGNHHGSHGNNSKKRPPPLKKQNNHRSNHGNKKQDYISHPQASNIDPVLTSPALGRPLSLQEYMRRPSTSFVDDPWNFDPFAVQMNAGLHTDGLKYNYDPLGANTLSTLNDPSYSHLQNDKLSFPGDAVVMATSNNEDFNDRRYSEQQYSNNNHGDSNYGDSSVQQTIVGGHPKIEFTIETSPDGGINVRTDRGSDVIDEAVSEPFGPNGYYTKDANTPEDMMPPIMQGGSRL